MGRAGRIAADGKLNTDQIVLCQRHRVADGDVATRWDSARGFSRRVWRGFCLSGRRRHLFFELSNLPHNQTTSSLIKLFEVWIQLNPSTADTPRRLHTLAFCCSP